MALHRRQPGSFSVYLARYTPQTLQTLQTQIPFLLAVMRRSWRALYHDALMVSLHFLTMVIFLTLAPVFVIVLRVRLQPHGEKWTLQTVPMSWRAVRLFEIQLIPNQTRTPSCMLVLRPFGRRRGLPQVLVIYRCRYRSSRPRRLIRRHVPLCQQCLNIDRARWPRQWFL